MSFPKYEAYKDSGVEWLGEVPEHWKVLPIKRDLEFLTSGSRGWAEYYSDEGALFIRIGNLTRHGVNLDLSDIQRVAIPEGSEGERTRVQPGDVLFSITAYLGSVAVAPDLLEKAYVSQHVALARLFGKKLLPSWVAYITLSQIGKDYLASQGYGGTKIQLALDDVANLITTAPSLEEQTQIIRFLDHETARIDALIAEQERLIELLKEKRQAVISHAVTKGLDPTAPMKDSGVEWLGEVPAHWVVARVKHVIQSFEQGWSPQCDNVPVENGEEWGVLKVGCVNSGIFSPTENKRLPDNLDPIPDLFLKAGDVLISRANTRELVGSAALVDADQPNLMLSDKLFRLRVMDDILPKYLVFYLGINAVRHQIELEATGASSSMLNIGQSVIKELSIPVPPITEQQTITAHLEASLDKLYRLQTEAQLTQSLLQERRSALISAAVTGKIDVRGWQPPASAAPAPTLEPAHG